MSLWIVKSYTDLSSKTSFVYHIKDWEIDKLKNIQNEDNLKTDIVGGPLNTC